MQKRWVWVISGVLAAGILGAAGWAIWQMPMGQRVVQHLDQAYELTEAGRQANFDELWAEAKAQFEETGATPARDELLKEPDRVLAKLAEVLPGPESFSAFASDLLIALKETPRARALVDIELAAGRCFGAQSVLKAFYSEDALKQLVLTHPQETCQSNAWFALSPASQEDPAFLAELVKAFAQTDIPHHLLSNLGFQVAAVNAYDQLGKEARLSLIRASGWTGLPSGALEGWADREPDPAVRQELLSRLGRHAELVQAIERDGAFKVNSFWSNWQWESEMAAKYPDSFLARGIKAYEAVRGKSYFQWDRRDTGADWPDPWEHGNHQYDPDREIPGWTAYLRDFVRHPGADDAAYRLGRSYEIKGQYSEALKALLLATTLPDGEMAIHARNRIAWILDAHLTEEELTQLKVPDLQVAIDYSIAVRKLRTGRYAEAIADLDRVLAHSDEPAPVETKGRAFWPGVEAQRDKAATLQALAADKSPEGRYKLAAAIYHDEMIFYNYLWGGWRAGYFYYASGHAAEALMGDMDARYTRWIAGFNNYVQAAEAFAALESVPGEVGEKAAYSRALCLLKLERGYGADVALWKPEADLADEAAGLLERFVAERPKSSLADDALLSLAYLKQDVSYAQRIIKEYPRSDMAPAAAGIRFEMPRSGGTWLPFRYLTLSEAPPEVAAWAKGYLGTDMLGTLQSSGVTYVMIASSQPGRRGQLSIWGRDEGYVAHPRWTPDPEGTSYVLARAETTRPIKFPTD
ncbi:MAG: putative rane protein [Symbiobacteriaceae bacterium]|nr:putative rane protein [Symbiobacteriaceae bacterium]